MKRADRLIERLKRADGRPVLCDGAMGTLVGTSIGNEKFTVKKCHELYVAAGAEAITTHTLLTGVQTPEEIEAACRLAREAAGEERWVMGSTGSTWIDGVNSYRSHFGALVRSGVDVLLLETVSRRKVAIDALEAWQSMDGDCCELIVTLCTGLGGKLIYDDSDTVALARELLENGVAAVGVNCGGGWRELIDAGRRLADGIGRRVIVRPSIMDRVHDEDFEPRWWVDAMAEAVDEGFVAMAGGCCGTTPDYIAALYERMNMR